MDIGSNSPEIHRLADIVTEYQLGVIRHLLARGVEAIQFGDDFGTQACMMLSPASWRRFFRPRYEMLMRPVREAGKRILFHTCGYGRPLLDDLAAMGVHAIWPQLNSYPEDDLERFCRESRVAIALHPDRGELMTHSTPADVRYAGRTPPRPLQRGRRRRMVLRRNRRRIPARQRALAHREHRPAARRDLTAGHRRHDEAAEPFPLRRSASLAVWMPSDSAGAGQFTSGRGSVRGAPSSTSIVRTHAVSCTYE